MYKGTMCDLPHIEEVYFTNEEYLVQPVEAPKGRD
jgi:hypothetical protein